MQSQHPSKMKKAILQPQNSSLRESATAFVPHIQESYLADATPDISDTASDYTSAEEHYGSYPSGSHIFHDAAQKELLESVKRGLKEGTHKLVLASDGLGGTYFVVGPRNRHVAVFKPSAQEVGMPSNPKGYRDVDKAGFPPGLGYKREVAAYLLDHGHSAGVPTTVEVELMGEHGSLQQFVHCDGDASSGWNRFKTDVVHRVGVLDIRMLNCDRHEGNLLCVRDPGAEDVAQSLTLVPIDHGYALPEGGLQDLEFDWAMFPQSKQPFAEDTLRYIAALDADADVRLLSQMGFSEDVTDNLKAATLVLQHASGRGYTLREIGEFCRRTHMTQPSGLEAAIAAARTDMDAGGHIEWGLFQSLVAIALPHLSPPLDAK